MNNVRKALVPATLVVLGLGSLLFFRSLTNGGDVEGGQRTTPVTEEVAVPEQNQEETKAAEISDDSEGDTSTAPQPKVPPSVDTAALADEKISEQMIQSRRAIDSLIEGTFDSAKPFMHAVVDENRRNSPDFWDYPQQIVARRAMKDAVDYNEAVSVRFLGSRARLHSLDCETTKCSYIEKTATVASPYAAPVHGKVYPASGFHCADDGSASLCTVTEQIAGFRLEGDLEADAVQITPRYSVFWNLADEKSHFVDYPWVIGDVAEALVYARKVNVISLPASTTANQIANGLRSVIDSQSSASVVVASDADWQFVIESDGDEVKFLLKPVIN